MIKKKKSFHELRLLSNVFGNKIKVLIDGNAAAEGVFSGTVQPGSGHPPCNYIPQCPTHNVSMNI